MALTLVTKEIVMIRVLPFSAQTNYKLGSLNAGIFGVGFLTAIGVALLKSPHTLVEVRDTALFWPFIAFMVVASSATVLALSRAYDAPRLVRGVMMLVFILSIFVFLGVFIWARVFYPHP